MGVSVGFQVRPTQVQIPTLPFICWLCDFPHAVWNSIFLIINGNNEI